MFEPTVVVRFATSDEGEIVQNLFQLYVHDFSELEPATSERFELDARGRFAPYPDLDAYWTAPDRWPLLFVRDGRPVGFALVNTRSHRDGGFVERNMAELFVVRKHRRHGVATEAVRRILALLPGRWEVAVAERNVSARAFWTRTLSSISAVRDLETRQGDGRSWRGPIHAFVAE